MPVNEGHGNLIFLRWNATEAALPKARELARKMARDGTTFRGCSYDVFVYRGDECPVCGCSGEREYRLPPARVEYVQQGAHWQPRRKKAR
jgi:hypothetical protein